MSIARTAEWFELAGPQETLTDKRKLAQVGVHIEEIAEFFDAMKMEYIAQQLHAVGMEFKTSQLSWDEAMPLGIDRKETLDALADIIVTSVGVAHALGMDIATALDRVNESNFSKFVDGKPIFDENMKVRKGPNYKKPDLEGLY